MEAFHCSAREYLLSIFLGILSPFLYYLVLFKAPTRYSPPNKLSPSTTPGRSPFRYWRFPCSSRRIRWPQWLALVISYGGVVVISTEGHPLSLHFTDPFGVALALFSTIIWALYWIFQHP